MTEGGLGITVNLGRGGGVLDEVTGLVGVGTGAFSGGGTGAIDLATGLEAGIEAEVEAKTEDTGLEGEGDDILATGLAIGAATGATTDLAVGLRIAFGANFAMVAGGAVAILYFKEDSLKYLK